jgi:uncharacterized membrane protein YgcG
MPPLAWPFGRRQTMVIVGLVMLGFGMSPMRVANRLAFMLYHTPAAVFKYARVPPPAPHTLKAAVLNVTADFNEARHWVFAHLLCSRCIAMRGALIQPSTPPPPLSCSHASPNRRRRRRRRPLLPLPQLTYLIHDFLHSPGVDPELEPRFRQFLAERAVRSHPQLESALDWLLGLYKFAAPFLAISLLAKLAGDNGGDEGEAGGMGGGVSPPPSVASGAGGRWAALGAAAPLPLAAISGGQRRSGGGGRQVSSPEGPDTPQEVAAGQLRAQLDALAEPYRRRGGSEDRAVLRARGD